MMNLLVVWDWKAGANGRQILRFCFQIVNECNLTGKAKVVDNLNGLEGGRTYDAFLVIKHLASVAPGEILLLKIVD